MSVSNDGFGIGSIVTYTCLRGYKSSDPGVNTSESRCQLSRNWQELTSPLSCMSKYSGDSLSKPRTELNECTGELPV